MHKNKETQIKATQCSHLDINYSHNTKHLAKEKHVSVCATCAVESQMKFLLRTVNLNTQLTHEGKDVFHYVHILSKGVLSYFAYFNHLHVYLLRI
jgi:hypothetical protein